MSHQAVNETFISVDIETAGPVPQTYSMLSIGACTLYEPLETFYVELQPITTNYVQKALAVSGLNLTDLKQNGVAPKQAMQRFASWLNEVTPTGSQPVFLAFNAPFDWMFVSDYFYRFLEHNPFGHKALDIKAYYMGMQGVSWSETGMNSVMQRYLDERELTHNALQDALDQAEIFRKMLAETKTGVQNAPTSSGYHGDSQRP
jgi:DNA polymerase III epsilon subunit-like protein